MKLSKTEWLAFFIVVLIFILVQAKGLFHIAPGDENVYYYMAKSVGEGQFPYRDFFYAHPPMHVLILSAIIKIFGVNFTVLKSTTLIALLTSSFFLYKTSLALFRNQLNDRHAYITSLLALILFLFSFEVMFKATFSMGINFSLMFLVMSFYFIFTSRYFIGGIFAGLAGLTRFYALAPLLIVFIFVLVKKIQAKKIKDFLHMTAGFLMTFGVAIILLMIFFGQHFIDMVFRYHLLKLKLPNQRTIVYKNVLEEDWIIILAFSLSAFIKNKNKFQLFFFVVFGYLLFLLSLNVPAEFYFSIGLPFMAIIGSYSLVDLIRKINIKSIRYSIVLLLSLIFLWNTTADVMFLEKIGFLGFSPLNQLASAVSPTKSNQKLFGDDSIVPLLALIANKSIALNYIDSNEMRFTSGMTNFYLFKEELDSVNLSYIIFRRNKGLHQISQFRQYAAARCSLENVYSDIAEGDFLVYQCIK